MNYESVYETVEAKLADLFPAAKIHRPNETAYKKSGLDIDLFVSENDVNVYTEDELKRDVSIDILISTPATDGTERCNNIADKLQSSFSPIVSKTSGFFADFDFLDINSVRQMPANIEDARYSVNVRILATLYTDR
jgi:hypothetical protein